MSQPVIKVENLSKLYRLGTIGTGILSHDLNRWWVQPGWQRRPILYSFDECFIYSGIIHL